MDLKRIKFQVNLKATSTTRDFILQKAYTNDLSSVQLIFELQDCTEAELTGATANILLYMRDGSFFQDTAVITGNTVTHLLTEAQGNHSGIAKAQVTVTLGELIYASPIREFEIISGLETAVAVEIMIKDWTMLTAEARAFIDAAEAAEALRVSAETGRANAESARVTAESSRVTAENIRITNEAARVTGYAQMDARITDQSKTVQDLDSGRNYSAVLEVLDGQPRLKITEVL